MKIYYQKFYLYPKKSLNRLSGLRPREGVFFLSESDSGARLAEYFPHPEFGDDSVDTFLTNFSIQNTGIISKIKQQLTLDINNLEPIKFLNHQLWRANEQIYSKIIKYKIYDNTDVKFLSIIDQVNSVRLDANGIFNRDGLLHYSSLIPKEFHSKIEYIEDPTSDLKWSNLPFKSATDFLMGNHSDFVIYKPSRSPFPKTQSTTIFSGNMGHAIGQYHDCRELFERGDLNLYHGIITTSLYENVPELFVKQSNSDFYTFSNSTFNSFLADLLRGNWTFLCQSI